MSFDHDPARFDYDQERKPGYVSPEARSAIDAIDAARDDVLAALARYTEVAREHDLLNLNGRYGFGPETAEECIANWLEHCFCDGDLIDKEKLRALENGGAA